MDITRDTFIQFLDKVNNIREQVNEITAQTPLSFQISDRDIWVEVESNPEPCGELAKALGVTPHDIMYGVTTIDHNGATWLPHPCLNEHDTNYNPKRDFKYIEPLEDLYKAIINAITILEPVISVGIYRISEYYPNGGSHIFFDGKKEELEQFLKDMGVENITQDDIGNYCFDYKGGEMSWGARTWS